MNTAGSNSVIKQENVENKYSNGVPFPPAPSLAQNQNIKQESEDISIEDQNNDIADSDIKQEPMHQQLSYSEEQVQSDIQGLNLSDTKPSIKVGQEVPDQSNIKIIHRQISDYVGFANLPKQWHRRSIRKGFNLNLLCVGKSGMGKSTLINSLFNEDFVKEDGIEPLEPVDTNSTEDEGLNTNVKIETITKTLEENGVKLKLTVIDAPGFADTIDNTNSWEPIIKEINTRFDEYLDSENKISRPYNEDNRVHACLYFIEPTGHCLKPLDLELCAQIHDKCNLIPIIAKSDILTDEEITTFKKRITKQLADKNIQCFKPPVYKLDDKETIEVANKLYENLPYAVVGSNDFIKDPSDQSKMIRAREYPWGVIQVESSKDSDFMLLRDLLIKQYLEELHERTNNVLYEKYRSEKLSGLGIKQDNSVFKEFDPNMRQEEEKKLHEAKLQKLETEMKNVFQQKVSEKEKKLQKSETELFARHKEMKEKLSKQLKALEEKKHQLEMTIQSQAQSSPAQPKKKGFLR